MIHFLMVHVAQSTVFALVAGLLTLALRKNKAQVRYWLWLTASVKFLVPFAFLMNLGSALETWSPGAHQIAEQTTTPAVAWTVEQLSEPLDAAVLPSSSTPTIDWIPVVMTGAWLCGFAAIAVLRFRSWRRVRNAVRASTLIGIPSPVEVRISPGLLEPGVVGILGPVLLLPEGILNHLTPSELETVLAHELCHIRRRDNLFASLHTLAEAMFWFHPLVWWIGARLVDERERACDEEVLNQGNQPDVYAEAILNVCKLYTESPLACVSGVTGASIKRRIETIMSNRKMPGLNRAKKFLLAATGLAALAGPVAIGLIMSVGNASVIRAQSPQTRRPRFDVASIKPFQAGDGSGRGGGGDMGANRGVNPGVPEGVGGYLRASPGRLDVTCGSVLTMVNLAYVVYGNPLLNNPAGPSREPDAVKGVPKWALDARYTIHAETDDPTANGPTQPERGKGPSPAERLLYGPMLQALLEERFQLKIHRTIEEAPMYALTVAKSGFKLKPMKEGDCIAPDPDKKIWDQVREKPVCGTIYGGIHGPNRTWDLGGKSLHDFAETALSRAMDHKVLDKTGVKGVYALHLEYAPDERTFNPFPIDNTSDIPPGPSIFSALEQLGLRLETVKGPKEQIMIDHVQPPSEN